MPDTYREIAAAHGLGPDPYQPRDNILAGTAYLRAMYDRYGYPGVFAAYNAGPGRYEDYLRRGRRLPAETRAYVVAVTGSGSPPASRRAADALAATSEQVPRDRLFFAVRARPEADFTPQMERDSGLFVPLGHGPGTAD